MVVESEKGPLRLVAVIAPFSDLIDTLPLTLSAEMLPFAVLASRFPRSFGNTT
jgi:hypothetical protein